MHPLFGASVLALTLGPLPPHFIETLVSQMVSNITNNEAAKRARIVYEKVKETRDANGKVKSVEIFAHYGKHGKAYDRLIEKNGKSVGDREEEISEPFLDGTMGKRFSFSFAQQDIAIIDGRLCYVLNFTPTGLLPGRDDEERILNRLVGTAYVDAEKFYIRRLVGHLPEGANVVFGFLGSGIVKEFSIVYEQKECYGLVINTLTSYTTKVKKLFIVEEKTVVTTYRNFRPPPR